MNEETNIIQTVAFLGESLFVKEQDKELLHSFHDNVVQIKYDSSVNYLDYLDTLDLNSLTQVGFFYHYKGYYRFPFFQEVERKIDITGIPIRSKYHYFSDLAIEVFRKLKGEKDTLIIDLVSCRLNGDDFKQEVERIEQELGVDIRYSVDETGNRENGGNWVMESDDVNIKNVYFTDAISQWTGVLAPDFGSLVRNGYYTDYFSYDSTTKTIKVLQSFQWSAADLTNNDFIELQENEIFDGQGHTIDLSGIANWEGLISVLLTLDDSNKPTIKNIGMLNGNLTHDAGYVIKKDQRFFNVMYCYSTGDIGNNDYCGGIIGKRAGNLGNCNISNCYSTGDITGKGAGGIAGVSAGYRGNCNISNCYSTGDITGKFVGGIAGIRAGYLGNCNISNCYSSGAIKGVNAGGITGDGAGSASGKCNISNCYSTGLITDTRAGGITGNGAGNNNGICDISNCYSTGVITGSYAGGITGKGAGNYGTCNISNCYSTGDITGQYAGGIAGPSAASNSSSNCTISSCYSIGDITGQYAGSIAGINSNCTISYCIYNSPNIAGTNSSITETDNSNNLTLIDNQLYNNWSSDIWQVGDDITLDVYNSSTDSYNSQTLNLPILNAFKKTKWDLENYNIPTDNPILLLDQIKNIDLTNIDTSTPLLMNGITNVTYFEKKTTQTMDEYVNELVKFNPNFTKNKSRLKYFIKEYLERYPTLPDYNPFLGLFNGALIYP